MFDAIEIAIYYFAIPALGWAFLILGPIYIVGWFAIEIRKSWRNRRDLTAAQKRDIAAGRRIAEARRSVVGSDV
jgi:hypothetical protein